MSLPNIPLITLRRGPWQADLFDPRPNPRALGARFVHGGWVARLARDGRSLTGGAVPYWHAYDAIGLPETFESGLGWHLAEKGQEFLRPGAGRLIRTGDDPTEEVARAKLSSILEWDVEITADEAVFRTSDGAQVPEGPRYSYQLERRIRLLDDGLVSTTTFALKAQMIGMLPVSWFAHPFFPQTRADGTGYTLPPGATQMPRPRFWFGRGANGGVVQGADGQWRVEGDGGRAVFGGVWGTREPTLVHLEGGGVLEMRLDAPLDHLVIWASQVGSSVEPKLARSWISGEQVTWSLAYRWRDQA